MLNRLFIIILFVPLLIWIFLKGDYSFLLFIEVIIGISMFEFYKMIDSKFKPVSTKTAIFLGLLLPIFVYFNNTFLTFNMGSFIAFSILILSIKKLFSKYKDNFLVEVSLILFGIIYISYLLSHILLIKQEFTNGRIMVLFMFLSIWTCDISAYIVGNAIGTKIFKRRLAPSISPSKSIEGAIGGIIGVIILSLSFNSIYIFIVNILIKFNLTTKLAYNDIINLNYTEIFLFAILISIFVEIGDLVESKIKRECNIKDSGNILLGHGGFLDRFDSTIFAAPFMYYFFRFIVN